MQHDSSGSVAAPTKRVMTAALLAVLLTALLSIQTLAAPLAQAADPTPRQYQDQTFAAAGPSPTEDKPQSKLWFNDGSWWALMRTNTNGSDGNPDITIHRLQPDHTWLNTKTVIDARSSSTGDALWEGGKLYVASRVPSGNILAVRLSYNAVTKTYTMDSGFPMSIPGGSIESVTIARDSRARLWITFTKPHPSDSTLDQVWVAHSTTNDTTWTAPFLVPVSDNVVKADDISAIVAFGGKVGVMWSDQQTQVMRFALHTDSAADNAGWTLETPVKGTRSTDDHLNLKSLLEDDAGRIYAAIKTSRGDVSTDTASDPSLLVLSRSSTGTWTSGTVATVSEKLTRPQLALDATNRQVYVVMSTENGGNIYYRKSPFGANLSFTPKATLLSFSGALVNNATTAKAPVTASTGLVVLAADEKTTKRYYHAELDLGGTPTDTSAPTVPTGVTATPDSSSQVTVGWDASTDAVGVASYEVQRNGTTVAPAVTGATSYVDSGVTASTTYSYTVSAVDAAGNRSAASAPVSATTPASAPALTASFTTSPSSGPAPLAVQFTDTSTGGPTGWSWTFGDGTTSNLQSPSHSYPAEGSYTATLTVTGASGSSTSPPQTVTVTSTPQPGGAVTVGGSDQAVSTTALSTVTVPRPATGVADNDVLIVQITTDGGPDISTTPTGWLPVITPQSVGTSARVFAYYRVISAAADEPATYTWGLSAAVKWNAAVTSFHGVDTANPFDTEASTSVSSTASTSRTVPEVTTTTAGTMLVGGMGPNSGTAGVTPPAGWTESVESSGGQVAELAYQARPTAGATGAATWKLGSSLGSAAWLTALRPI